MTKGYVHMVQIDTTLDLSQKAKKDHMAQIEIFKRKYHEKPLFFLSSN